MSWNYRVVKSSMGKYAIPEVYYDENIHPNGMSKEPVTAWGESIDGVMQKLAVVEKALDKDVFIEPDNWVS